MSVIEEILERWPLRTMCSRLGITLPERAGRKFHSPFRPDGSPSCTIYREIIRDWSTGETFDSIRCFAERHALTNKEAIRQLASELPGRGSCSSALSFQESKSKCKSKSKEFGAAEPFVRPLHLHLNLPLLSQERVAPSLDHRPPLAIPGLHYTDAEAQTLAEVRGLSLAAVQMAGLILGILGFGEVGGFRCWVLRDTAGQIAEARRLDGQKFPAVGSLGERKSHTLRGSRKSWPIGLHPQKFAPAPGVPVMLCEGGPDLLAACDILFAAKREFLPVAMLGAGQAIDAEAVPGFAGREVTILAHPDEAGEKAAQRWAAQLRAASATPRIRGLEGGDLNDLVTRHGADAVAAEFGLV